MEEFRSQFPTVLTHITEHSSNRVLTDQIDAEVVQKIDETLRKHAPKKIKSRVKSWKSREKARKAEKGKSEEKATGENNTGDEHVYVNGDLDMIDLLHMDPHLNIAGGRDDFDTLLDMLQEVAAYQPLVSLVIVAFNSAFGWLLHKKENNTHILNVHVSMRHMVADLVQLYGIRQPIASSGSHTSLRSVVQQMKEQIEECTAFCRDYSEQSWFTKVFKSSEYQKRFMEYHKTFARLRALFPHVLQLYTAVMVSDVLNQQAELHSKILAVLPNLSEEQV